MWNVHKDHCNGRQPLSFISFKFVCQLLKKALTKSLLLVIQLYGPCGSFSLFLTTHHKCGWTFGYWRCPILWAPLKLYLGSLELWQKGSWVSMLQTWSSYARPWVCSPQRNNINWKRWKGRNTAYIKIMSLNNLVNLEEI